MPCRLVDAGLISISVSFRRFTLGGEMEEGMEEEQGGTEESRTNQLISVDVIDGPLPRFFQAMDSSSIVL